MIELYKLYGPGETTAEEVAARLPKEIETPRGALRLRYQRLTDGPSRDVELLQISGSRAGVALLPTRGMGLWRAWSGETQFGWRSPVRGPVHPALVPLSEPSGLGWLSGFDELLVRCGLESNGAVEFDEKGRLQYPLHGRIANLPAESLRIAVDEDAGMVEVRGVVRESRLFFTNLSLESTVRIAADSDVVEVEDRVTNHSDCPAGHQMLYHINVGRPLLGEGAELLAPALEVVPKTAGAAADVDTFQRYRGPQAGFVEQVYLMRLASDSAGWSRVLLRSPDGRSGFGVSYDTSTLPYFTQWKNTAGEADGYVTGLEPASGFPNTRSFEEAQGRVVTIPPGQSVTYRLKLHLLASADRVEAMAAQVRELEAKKVIIDREPRPGWCE